MVTSILEIAERISREAHSGQMRKDGSPYIKHVESVVAKLKGDELAQAVAWLHDVLEDTDVEEAELLEAGISEEIVSVVLLLTKRREQTYNDYIERVSQNGIARKVKVADIISNLNDNPGNKQIVKFSKALVKLCAGR